MSSQAEVFLMLPSSSRRRAWLCRRATLGSFAVVAALLAIASRLWGGHRFRRSSISAHVAPKWEPATSLPEDSEDFLSRAASGKGAGEEGSGRHQFQPGTGGTITEHGHIDSKAGDRVQDSTHKRQSLLSGEGASKVHRQRPRSAVPSSEAGPLGADLSRNLLNRSQAESGRWRKFKEEARSKAEAFCGSDRYKAMREERASYKLVDDSPHIRPMSMYVLGGNDFVSYSIVSMGYWDINKAREMVSLMSEVQKVTGRDTAAFADVGANVGWFSIYFASRNTSVFAFEAMPGNQDAIMGTLCSNPAQAHRVELHQLALGDRRQSCVLYAHRSNKGNGQIKCMAPEARASWKLPPDMEGKGDVQMYRLDDVLGDRDLNIGVAKMDVEGYEGWVLEGGREALRRLQIPYIVTEFTRGGLTYRGFDPARFLEVWDELGYDVRRQCRMPETAIRVDRARKNQCGRNATCLAEVPHVRFAASNEAEGADLCCVLRSYSQERNKVLA